MSIIEESKVDPGPPDSDYTSNLKWLIDSLPNHLNADPDKGNHALLDPIGKQVDELDRNIEAIDDAKSVQRANSIGEIDRLAALVDLAQKPNESLEAYRARVLARFQINTSEGTFDDIFGFLSDLLEIAIEQIWYADWNLLYGMDRHVFFLPYAEVKAHPLNDTNISDVVSEFSAAGKKVETMYAGSMRPVSKQEYQSTDWSGYEAGATGLDNQGNIIDGGGTVGGFLDLD